MLFAPRGSARIRQVASGLEALANIPLVKQQLGLIAEVQTDAVWKDIAPEGLEALRRALRGPVQLIEPVERRIVCTAFTDGIGQGTELPVDAAPPGMDKLRVAMKLRRFLKKRKDHIALQQLRCAEQLTASDPAELGKMFEAEGVRLGEAKPETAIAGSPGLFLQSLTGMERKAGVQHVDRGPHAHECSG